MNSPSLALRPATVEALAKFRERRRKLLFKRAGLTAAVLLLCVLLVVALLDRATFMPDGLRKVLSYLAYGVAAVSGWWMSMRLVKDAQGLFAAAQLMEQADAKMHERLFSAVELSKDDDKDVQDSPEFRARLQDDVAKELEGFNAEALLPDSLLKPWFRGLTAIGVVIVGLSFVPGLHLPGFMARAALPFANFSRPSSVKIKIVSPSKGSAMVPLASSVPLGVQIEGTVPKRVLVETQSEGSKVSRMELGASHGNLYEGSIGIGQTSVRYRVLAGDAISAWHTLDARARPRVVEFVKVITPPSYAGLPEQTITDDHGDLTALEGSTVKLTLKTNQMTSQSVATLLPELKTLEVQQDKAGTLTVAIPMDGKSDSWQMALTGKETGFTNEESSPWRIETLPDLPPAIAITKPEEQLEVRTDDEVTIIGHATDDVALLKIEMSYAINGAGWKDSVVVEKPGREVDVTSPFKLGPLPVKTGDAILVKLVATDGKGQRAESTPVRLFIVEDKLNLAQREWAEQQRRLAQQASALRKDTAELRKDVDALRDTDKKEKGQDKAKEEEAEAALARVKQELAGAQEKANELWEQVKENAKKAPNQLKALETNLLGERLASLRGQHLKEMQEQTTAEDPDEKLIKQAANRAAEDSERLDDALRAFAAAETAQAAKEAFEHLAPQQNRLADKAIEANRNPEERTKWQEQQRAALAASQNAQKDLQALQEAIQEGRKNDVKGQLENLGKKVPKLEAALDTEKQHQAPEFLYGQTEEVRHATNQARDTSSWLAEETANKANEMRERLGQENPVFAALNQAREAAESAANEQSAADKKAERKGEDEATKKQESADAMKEQAADRLAAAARQFKDISELREQNQETNNQAALDMNRMGRALDNLAEQMRQGDSSEDIKKTLEKANQLTKAARALEADATAQDAQTALAQAEAKALNQTAPEEPMAEAKAAASQLKQLPEQVRKAEADNQAANLAQEAAGQAQWQENELKGQQQQAAQQKQGGQQPAPISPEQNKALQANRGTQQKLKEAMDKMAPKVAEARQNLEQMTPKLSELAKNVAGQLEKSQQQTEQVAQAAQNNQAADQTAEQANALMPKAGEDEQKLKDLQAALRQEADKANLSDEVQRQMARTADVGLEQMRQETPQIAQNLQQAAKAPEASQQAQALQKASQSQQKTAKSLEQLAQNLEQMEKGQALPQDALAAQQAMEEELGIKKPLDESYQDAESLSELMEKAQENPQEALSALEKQLKSNPQMQRALGNLAEQTAQQSQEALAQAQSQPFMTQEAAKAGAHELNRVTRHEERLGQKEAAKQVADLSKKLNAMAEAAKDPSKNTPQAAQEATQSAAAAQQAASQAAKAQESATPAPSSFLDAAKGAMLAQALDQLDQAVNPMQSGQGEGQQQQQAQNGQPTPQGQQQGKPTPQQSAQSAQNSLAKANQAQAQKMAQARAQGMVPGQAPQQPSQGPSKQGKGENDQSSAEETGNLTQGKANVMVPVLGVQQGGDWGRLPTRMAKDLTEASRQEPSPEYREAIESYYKAIAEKAKK